VTLKVQEVKAVGNGYVQKWVEVRIINIIQLLILTRVVLALVRANVT
jgi:hypothetical protein